MIDDKDFKNFFEAPEQKTANCPVCKNEYKFPWVSTVAGWEPYKECLDCYKTRVWEHGLDEKVIEKLAEDQIEQRKYNDTWNFSPSCPEWVRKSDVEKIKACVAKLDEKAAYKKEEAIQEEYRKKAIDFVGEFNSNVGLVAKLLHQVGKKDSIPLGWNMNCQLINM